MLSESRQQNYCQFIMRMRLTHSYNAKKTQGYNQNLHQAIWLIFLIIISVPQFYFLMGCCESRLLGIEDTSAKYENGPITINQHYQEKKDMVKIGVQQLAGKDNRSSLCTLRSNLEQAFKQFERQKGPITFTYLNQQHSPLTQNQAQRTIQKASNFTNKSLNSHSNFSELSQNSRSQSSQSQHCQHNTNILSNTSLQTKRQLEKQLFYINSNQIGKVKLLKWTEEGRLSFKIEKQRVFESLGGLSLEFIAALYLVLSYEQKNSIHLMVYKQLTLGLGLRVFVNGIKRMIALPVQPLENNLLISIGKIPNIFNQILGCTSFWVYMMTGWIPQIISISGFDNTKEILRKLAKNLNFGNLIVAFSSINQSQILLTESIDVDSQYMNVVKIWKDQLNLLKNQKISISWRDILQSNQFIHVNWNPFIYSFVKKVEGAGIINQLQTGQKIITVPKFRVNIPSSKSEVEVRILIQIHQSSNLKITQFELLLYQSSGCYLNFEQKNVPIRATTSINPLFLSEIFMFEQCQQESEYILAISIKDYQHTGEVTQANQFQLTMDLSTFCQIKAEFMKQPKLISNQQVISPMSLRHAGFGMNSPLFKNNLQYSLSTKPDTICRLKIKIDAIKPVLFEICVLPDYENHQDITLIKPQQLVRDAIQSDEFETEAQFQFKPKAQKSLILIVCFTPAHGRLILNCEQYTIEKKDEIQCFRIEEVQTQIKFWREFTFFWSQLSPGPRKRTINNSEKRFYSIETFEKFFENPFIDYYLPEGYYQFSVISKKFSSQFSVLQEFENQDSYCEKLLNASPPSLSMGIYELNDQKNQVKIVVDDYEYVPYGIGFWTAKLKLAGLYRFVLSKIQQQQQEGVFRIRKFSSA